MTSSQYRRGLSDCEKRRHCWVYGMTGPFRRPWLLPRPHAYTGKNDMRSRGRSARAPGTASATLIGMAIDEHGDVPHSFKDLAQLPCCLGTRTRALNVRDGTY